MFSLVLRTLVLYLFVILAVRLMGKKQLSELQPSELVTTIIISNIVTVSLEESNIPLLAGIIPIMFIVCIDVLITGVNLKSNQMRKITTGSPNVIISNGTIDQQAMRNLRYTIDDIMESMREASIFDISEIQFAIVENTGKISFLQKADSQQACDPQALIIKDGQIDADGLNQSGQDEKWLNMILNEKQISVKDVFLLSADKNGTYNFVAKQKKPPL
ncbi:MAG: DUF421 domain-containing protein [Oscillospiraceae bacterium]|nr:DUF421 domain-containing protein [Oscillospiraceae bacterium]